MSNCTVRNYGLTKYQNLLEQQNYFDYSSILNKAALVLSENDEVRSRFKNRIKYVIVDEYQDVNPVQESIVSELYKLGAGICVVGDDDQTIYQWRGSDVENIVKFTERYRDAEQIDLVENHRSSQGIVNTAKKFIEQNENRIPKQMVPASNQVYEEGDIVALSFSTPDEEAKYIADTISSLRGIALEGEQRGLSWSDMTILFRSVKNNAAPVIEALQQADIPFIVTGMKDLFITREAEAARNLFRFMADDDQVSKANVEQAWLNADIGVSKLKLQAALDAAEDTKGVIATSMNWEDGSIQRVFLDFLKDAEIRGRTCPRKTSGKLYFIIWGSSVS